MSTGTLIGLYPKAARELLVAGGKELVTKLGEAAIREVVLGVLRGENLRDKTEGLTRRKIAVSTAALTVFFVRGVASDKAFLDTLGEQALLARKTSGSTKEDKWILNWLLGLTDKAVQNVLRDDFAKAKRYLDGYRSTIKDVVADCRGDYGDMSGHISIDAGREAINAPMSWDFLIPLLGAIGTQALTIRGSDKSTYGKLFERLVLGSLLEILGFRQIDREKPPDDLRMVYWLSHRDDKRESDATAIISPGHGVRFDIGFIGRGNSEISLDKVSRFEREMDFGRVHHTMATYIVVDRIGSRSRLPELARRIDGTVVQMSLSYWPRTVAESLSRISSFSHQLVRMSDRDLDKFLAEAINGVSMTQLVPDHFEFDLKDENGDDDQE